MCDREDQRERAIRSGLPAAALKSKTLLLRLPGGEDFTRLPIYTGGNDPRPPQWSVGERLIDSTIGMLAVVLFFATVLVAGFFGKVMDYLNRLLPPLPWF